MKAAHLAALADALRVVIRAEDESARARRELLALVEQLVTAASSSADVYTTRELPPGMTKRAFHALARRLVAKGDRRVSKHGRSWVVERSALNERAPAPRAPASGANGATYSLEAALGRRGPSLRSTKGARA